MTTTKTTKVPVTSRNAYFQFYDIESLQNVFTLCVYDPRMNNVLVFYLVEPGTDLAATDFDKNVATKKIVAENPALMERMAPMSDTTNKIWFHDLSTYHANWVLARLFGLSDAYSVNDPDSKSSYDFEPEPGYPTMRGSLPSTLGQAKMVTRTPHHNLTGAAGKCKRPEAPPTELPASRRSFPTCTVTPDATPIEYQRSTDQCNTGKAAETASSQ